MRLDSFCIYTAENLEFLDTPVHIHVHGMTMHEYKTHVTFVRNVTHMKFFNSRTREFLNQENFHSGKFAPRENNPLYTVLILSWMATSTNEVGFHVAPAFTFPSQGQLPI